MKILKVTDFETAKKMLNKHKKEKPSKLIVKYYMDGCGACEDFEPKWQNVMNNLEVPDDFMVLDVENDGQKHLPIPSKMGFPTLSILESTPDGGLNELQEHVGSMSENKLMNILTKVISEQNGGKRKKRKSRKKKSKSRRGKTRRSKRSKTMKRR